MENLHGCYLEELSVGLSAILSKTITEADIAMIAEVTGDNNPVHMNADKSSLRHLYRIIH